MTDPEFKEKCDKYREKLEFILNSGILDIRNGKGILSFAPDGTIMLAERNDLLLKRTKM